MLVTAGAYKVGPHNKAPYVSHSRPGPRLSSGLKKLKLISSWEIRLLNADWAGVVEKAMQNLKIEQFPCLEE